MKNSKILVTGAAGFIGSHLVEEMTKNGTDVRAFIRYYSNGSIGLLQNLDNEILKNIEIIRGDLKDPEAVRMAVKGRNIVFHLGSLIGIPFSYQNPFDYVQTNIVGTANVLNAAREYSVEKIVHTSTSEVYGSAQYTPIDEDHPLVGQSPYSASKIAADKIAESYYLSFGSPVAIIRPFNTYGPRQTNRAIIPTIVFQALKSDKIKLGSLSPKRDLNYVKDTVSGFIRIAEESASIGQVINIGSGKEISIGDLVKLTGEILGKRLEVVSDVERKRPEKSEVVRLLCDNSKALELLGWEPMFSLKTGLEAFIDWAENNQMYNNTDYAV